MFLANFKKILIKIKEIWSTSLHLRIFFGIILAVFSIICIYFGGISLIIMSLFLISIGANEYKQFMLNIGVAPFFYIITFISFLILTVTIYKSLNLIPLIIFIGVFLSFCAILISKRKPYINNIATTILGFLICWLPCHLILLSQLKDKKYLFFGVNMNSGIMYLLILIFAVTATDLGAYIIGSKFGKRKLIEEISPNKTVVGAIGGGISAITITVLMGQIIDLSLIDSIFLGFLITIFAQIGDLSLSILKRDANLKHSGTLFLTYGGILDRLDSFIFSAPIIYYYFKYNYLVDIHTLLRRIFNF